jgi:hypothetical protein
MSESHGLLITAAVRIRRMLARCIVVSIFAARLTRVYGSKSSNRTKKNGKIVAHFHPMSLHDDVRTSLASQNLHKFKFANLLFESVVHIRSPIKRAGSPRDIRDHGRVLNILMLGPDENEPSRRADGGASPVERSLAEIRPGIRFPSRKH